MPSGWPGKAQPHKRESRADKTRIEVKMMNTASSNTVTIATGGSDVFNKAGGSTSLTLSLLNQGAMLQYTGSTAIWYVQSDDLPLSQLDGRYAQTTLSTAGAPTTGTWSTGQSGHRRLSRVP